MTPIDADVTGPPWIELAEGGTTPTAHGPLPWRRLLVAVTLVAVLVFIGVVVASALLARRTAEREAVNDALQITNVLAKVLQPVVDDELMSPDPATAAAARARMDPVVREQLLSAWVVRVKLWTPDGRIVYSDEPALIGETFDLSDKQDVFANPATKADVSSLDAPENRFERPAGQKLLEVYRPVWTPSGRPLLLETYARYDAVTARSTALWRGFGGITLTSLLLLLVAQAPLTWALVSRVRRNQAEREALLEQAVSASDQERQRIAATLHDSVVQELAASAFLVAGASARVRADGQRAASEQLDTAAEAIRSSIGGLRSLLVDIYPPSLHTAGLPAALRDLVAPLRSHDLRVELEVPDDVELADHHEALVFRVVQECLRNVVRHADAGTVRVVVIATADGGVRVDVVDDGVGFDPTSIVERTPEGHFGIRLMTDLARGQGARLRVRSAPGAGTHWRLEVPAP